MFLWRLLHALSIPNCFSDNVKEPKMFKTVFIAFSLEVRKLNNLYLLKLITNPYIECTTIIAY